MDSLEVANRLAGWRRAVVQHNRQQEHFQRIPHQKMPLPDTHNLYLPELSGRHSSPEKKGTDCNRRTGEPAEDMRVLVAHCTLAEDETRQ